MSDSLSWNPLNTPIHTVKSLNTISNTSESVHYKPRSHRKSTITSRSTLTSLLKPQQLNEIVSEIGKDVNLALIEKKSKQKVILGLILMFTSGILYSGLATLVRWGSTLGYSAAEMLLYRASVQIIVASISYYIQHKNIQKSYKNLPAKHIKNTLKKILGPKEIAAVIGRGIFGAASTFTYFEGTTLIPVGDCVTLKALAAVFTSFAGYIILGDAITIKHGFALLFAVIASILITQPPMIFNYIEGRNNDQFKNELSGYIISTASSCFQAGVYICIKLAGKAPAVILIFSQGTFSCILGVLILVFYEKEMHFFNGYSWKEYVCIFCVCSIGYGAQWTLTRGGQLLIAGIASLMRATDIVWSFLWGIIFFAEIPNYLTIIGAVTMFLSVLMVSLEKIKNSILIQQNIENDNVEGTSHTDHLWSVNKARFNTKNDINHYIPLPQQIEKFDDDSDVVRKTIN